MLTAYNLAIPNGAERVLRLVEEEATHRQYIERTLVESHVHSAGRGFWGSMSIVAAFFALAVWCLATGRDLGGVSAMIGALTFLVGTFIQRMKVNQQAEQEKEGKP